MPVNLIFISLYFILSKRMSMLYLGKSELIDLWLSVRELMPRHVRFFSWDNDAVANPGS